MRFFNLNVCEAVVSSLQKHLNSSAVGQFAGKTVGRLCEQRSVSSHLLGRFDSFPTYFLNFEPTDLMNNNDIDLKLTEEELANGFNNLNTKIALFLGCRNSLLDCNVIAALMNMLRSHITIASVVYNICRTIAILSHGKESIKERYLFGVSDAFTSIATILDIHKQDISICVVASQAIRTLCSENYLYPSMLKPTDELFSDEIIDRSILQFVDLIQSINQRKFRECGGCLLLCQVIKYHLESSSTDLTAVRLRVYKPDLTRDALVESASWAIAKLCEQCVMNREIVGSEGLCELFVDILSVHNKLSFEVTFHIIMALTHLSTFSSDNITHLAFTNLGEHLTSIVSKYLSFFGVNFSEKSINNGYTDSLTTMTSSTGNEYDILLEHICVLVCNICQESVARLRFGSAGFCRFTILLLNRYDRSPVYSSLILMMIASLTWQFPDNQTKLGIAGCKGIVSVLERYLVNDITASYAVSLGLSPLTTQQRTYLNNFKNEVLSPVSYDGESLQGGSNDDLLSIHSAEDDDHKSTASFGTEKEGRFRRSSTIGSKSFLSNSNNNTLTLFRKSRFRPSLIIEGLSALTNLSYQNELNRSKLQASSIIDILTGILSNTGNLSETAKECARIAMDSIISE